MKTHLPALCVMLLTPPTKRTITTKQKQWTPVFKGLNITTLMYFRLFLVLVPIYTSTEVVRHAIHRKCGYIIPVVSNTTKFLSQALSFASSFDLLQFIPRSLNLSWILFRSLSISISHNLSRSRDLFPISHSISHVPSRFPLVIYSYFLHAKPWILGGEKFIFTVVIH